MSFCKGCLRNDLYSSRL